jgi:transcriptional regulator with XRE-family HTH domain
VTHRSWYKRNKLVRTPTDASRALTAGRYAARLGLAQFAAMLKIHPRTLKRWENGETRPNATEWATLTSALAQFAPRAAIDLAGLVGAPSPIPVAPAPDLVALQDALLRAADRLDVAPGRVRGAVRDLVAAVLKANASLDDLARAAQERSDTTA